MREESLILEEMIKKAVQETVGKINGKYAVLLSGGLDSGLLTALSRTETTYSVKFPYGEKFDESKYRDEIIQKLNIGNICIPFGKEDVIPYLTKGLQIMKRPITHFSLAPLTKLFEKISEGSIKTILSGEGPDEYLGGYARYIIMCWQEKMYSFEELKNYKEMLDKFLGPSIERYAKITGRSVESLLPFWNKYQGLTAKMGYADLNTDCIEEMEQKIAAHYGITLLYPYMNDEIAEYCYNLPDRCKVLFKNTKRIFRIICRKYLPRSVVYRKTKMGGPVAPINMFMGWDKEEGDFGKKHYLKLQEDILRELKLI